ncbi:MAG: peptidase C1, partial [Anaerolineae bacterium]|nr:peptidase C1 [Anaerolineae bacterium]
VKHFDLYTLTDKAERDDHCANIYHKSILYLVSHAFEDTLRIPLIRDEGVPVLGMARCVDRDADLKSLFNNKQAHWFQAPNNLPENEIGASRSKAHGDFDDEKLTLISTVSRMLQSTVVDPDLEFQRSAVSMKHERQELDAHKQN